MAPSHVSATTKNISKGGFQFADARFTDNILKLIEAKSDQQ